ncbi:MAG: ferrous iron transporter B [Clostridia bacterium]|nr:ferrous iron transporter B [Clostridia bacterium]
MNSRQAQFKEILPFSRHLGGTLDMDIGSSIVRTIYGEAGKIARRVAKKSGNPFDWDGKLDDILTSPIFGFPIMLLLLGAVFWITIVGANYPSQALAVFLFWIEGHLTNLFMLVGAPGWLHGILILGMYRSFAWVVSVMLPPMAIFFPCFTFLEDLGYLPRAAFNLDHFFKKAGTNGKQALTMSMGFGCNAAGVIAARIIQSPRERLIAIITNNFVPCNGRFPILIILSTLFMGAGSVKGGQLTASLAVVGVVLVGISITLLASLFLSKTLLRGIPTTFTLELPPYRKPRIKQILVRSFLDRTFFVLRRAVIVAMPAGVIVWLFANIYIGSENIITIVSTWLDPIAKVVGLDGIILLAFILGLPANEIVIPIIIMSYISAGAMLEFDSMIALKGLLLDNGWTWLTAFSVMLFSLLHFPCGTTLWTIYSETKSVKYTFFTFIFTTAAAFIVCFLVFQGAKTLFF